MRAQRRCHGPRERQAARGRPGPRRHTRHTHEPYTYVYTFCVIRLRMYYVCAITYKPTNVCGTPVIRGALPVARRATRPSGRTPERVLPRGCPTDGPVGAHVHIEAAKAVKANGEARER